MLHLFDTARAEVVAFEAREPGRVSMYVCGPTVYGPPHLGHGRFSLVFDVLRRYLLWAGNDVTYVSNITDIDDKIIARAAEEGCSPEDLAARYEDVWWDAMDAIGVMRPSHDPHATAYVPEMVSLVERLVARGAAYETSDGVYFRSAAVDDYGLLARQSIESLRAGARVEGNDEKQSPVDFALWKKAKPGEPAWPSPWGPGRPGWHTECVVMSLGLLGAGFDIHGGGHDLAFPHHENERAQAVADDQEFARYWVHNGFVEVDGEKMSKSLGNSLLVSEVVKQVRPVELRYYLGAAHYRSTIEFSFEALEEAGTAYRRVEAFLRRAVERVGLPPETTAWPKAFGDAMDDDLGVPQALAVLHDTVRAGNAALDRGDSEAVRVALGEVLAMTSVLGVNPYDEPWAGQTGGEDERLRGALDALVGVVLEQRQEARARKDYGTADAIRDRLTAAGLQVEDTPAGPRWTLADGV